MLPDRVSNPGPLTYESGALPIALRGPAQHTCTVNMNQALIIQTEIVENYTCTVNMNQALIIQTEIVEN